MNQVLLLCTLLLLSLPSLGQATPPSELLTQMGFTLIPPQPATDFHLPQVNQTGTDHRDPTVTLKALKGKWSWVVFWATWCGPCRYELPTLQKLSEEVDDPRFALVGISIDQNSSDSVTQFLEETQIQFPVGHDQDGKVATAYKAFSVPTIYILSPALEVVAIFQGANNWEGDAIKKGVIELLAYKQMDHGQVQTTNSPAAVELPNNLLPPTLRLLNDQLPASLLTDQEFTLTVEIEVRRPLHEYLFKTPQLLLPNSIEILSSSTSSEASSEGAWLYYTFRLIARQSGKMTLGPVELGYIPRAGGKELFSRSSKIEIVIEKPFVQNHWPVVIAILLAAAVLTLWLRHHRQKGQRERMVRKEWEAKQLILKQFQSEHQQLLENKIRQSPKEYSLALLKFYAKLIADRNDENQAIVSRHLEAINYSEKILTKEEMASFEKLAEGRMKELSSALKKYEEVL